MRTLFVHAGAGKTGTSALQHFLSRNQAWLADQGISYPTGPGGPDAQTGISSGNGGWLADFVMTGKGKDDFLGQVLQAPGDTILISSEMLAHADRTSIDIACGELASVGVEMRMFYLVRNPDDWYLSAFQQQVKRHGYSGSYQEFCGSYPLEFVPAITAYESALGRSAVQVLSYEAGRADIVSYVLRNALGVHAPLPEHENRQVNRSLSTGELEVLLAANRMQRAAGINGVAIGARGTRFSDLAMVARPRVPSGLKFVHPFPPEARERLAADVVMVNERLEEGFIGFSLDPDPEERVPNNEDWDLLALLLLTEYQLQDGLAQLWEANNALADRLQTLEGAEQQLRSEMSMLRNSRSWRVTRPLRAGSDWLRRRSRGRA